MFVPEDADLFPTNPESVLQLVVSAPEILLPNVAAETENTENFSP
jgi:hypothetical protein